MDSSMATNVTETDVCRSVVVNTTSCASLLSNTVACTSSYNVDRLLRLHHQMSLMIYQHRHNYDKTTLLQVIFNYCINIVNSIVSLLSSESVEGLKADVKGS